MCLRLCASVSECACSGRDKDSDCRVASLNRERVVGYRACGFVPSSFCRSTSCSVPVSVSIPLYLIIVPTNNGTGPQARSNGVRESIFPISSFCLLGTLPHLSSLIYALHLRPSPYLGSYYQNQKHLKPPCWPDFKFPSSMLPYFHFCQVE